MFLFKVHSWSIVDQLDTILQGVYEEDWTKDQTANALLGVKEIYQLEFDKLFKMNEKEQHETQF